MPGEVELIINLNRASFSTMTGLAAHV